MRQAPTDLLHHSYSFPPVGEDLWLEPGYLYTVVWVFNEVHHHWDPKEGSL